MLLPSVTSCIFFYLRAGHISCVTTASKYKGIIQAINNMLSLPICHPRTLIWPMVIHQHCYCQVFCYLHCCKVRYLPPPNLLSLSSLSSSADGGGGGGVLVGT